VKYVHSLKWLINALVGLSLAWSTLAGAVANEIRIAVSDIGAGDKPAGGGLVDVIYSQKLLEQEFGRSGITVRWLFIKGAGPVINEGFANQQIDMAYLGDLASIVGRSRGLDSKVIGVAARGINHYLAVAKGENIHTLADLKGKRVGLFRGTAAELSFVSALESQGLKPTDVKIINLDFAAASAALAAKQIDATWGGNNTLALRDKGVADIPLSSRDLNGAGQLSGLILVEGKFARENSDILQRIIKVQHKAAAWASNPQNKEAFIQLLANQSGYPQDILRAEWDGLPPLAWRLSPDLDPQFVTQLTHAIDIARQTKLIRQPVDVQQWLDNSFLKTN